ncbi:MAG: hypothetical protein PF486_12030 [Prolixibacteraceae bacterium]|jgi:hypothetical protein|nr:hypothetical protein [Prolixibacteraceae bacterium]
MNDLLNIINFKKREEYQAEFDRIAKKILNSYNLIISEKAYRIREIEFYYYSENHTDFYCHNNPRQQEKANFYFHRFKDPEKYLRLRQKGIDITFGTPDKSYGGILIRAIQNINSGDVFTGIGKLTNKIIAKIGGPKEIQKLYDSGDNVFNESSSLHLLCSDNNRLKIFKKYRQGLNHNALDTDNFYLNSAYNYFTYPEISELI